MVADLGDRHAKEILVGDVDGDGTDELYVSVEGHMDEPTSRSSIPWRSAATTPTPPPDAGRS